ncbi:MAG: hypothetical protein IT385_10670, partial [Deltaproteobacteria bacterium]|nr:hypothetical protein [Deltaproteobacteria bacterium]
MRQLSFLLAVLLPLTAHASPTTDDNAGRWADTFVDDGGVLDAEGAEWDPVGRRVVLSEAGTPGTFLTAPIEPASFSAWGGLYLDYAAASDASVRVWVVSGTTVYGAGGATGTLAAPPTSLPLGASDRTGYNARASLAGVPASAASLQVLVALQGATLPPAVNAIEVSWTPKSIVTSRLEAPATVHSAETIGVRVNVAVSFVDATDLVVEALLPVAQANAASALQDQKVSFVSATHNGALSSDGTKVVWNLGTKKAGETFTLVYTTRTQMGILDTVSYRTTAVARLSNGADSIPVPVSTTIISSPGPVLERYFGAGSYRIDGIDYVFPDTDLEVIVQGWNYKFYPGSGGETMFDAYVWDDVSDLIGPAGTPHTTLPTAISHGGQFTATAIPLSHGKSIPANSVYWKKEPTHWPSGHLTVGQSFRYTYKVHVAKLTTDGGPITRGELLIPCGKLESHFASQLADTAPAGVDKLCRSIRVDEPFAPSGIFAKGEEIRGIKGVGAGDDLRIPLVKAAYGETMSYYLMTYNQGVSQLDDIVMIDRVPDDMIFEDAFLPAGGTILYYEGDEDTGDPSAPPAYDDGDFGAGWSTTLMDRSKVTWVAFRVPRLASIYFPDTTPDDGITPVLAEGEIVVTVRPPIGDCPIEEEIENRGLFYVYGYTPPNKPAVVLDVPLYAENVEKTIVVPDLPNLTGSVLSDSPTIAVANQPLYYTFHIRNASPPGSAIPLDDALGVTARINIPTVPANGVPTALLVDSVSAPGGTITYNLPAYITVTYPSALAPDTSRAITLTTRVPNGVIDGTTFSISARLDWSDAECGPATANFADTTGFFGLPALQVVKTADFAFGMTGTTLNYTLEYLNTAQSPSTRSWIVDRVAPGSRLRDVEVPVPNGQVWFSSVLPTTLPAALSPTDPFTDQRIGQHFTRALDTDGDGWVTAPAGTTYVAFLVDDGALSPPQLITGALRKVTLQAEIETTTLGAVVANQAAILSKELIQAISNKTNFTVTGRPGLRLTKGCIDVVATGAPFTYTVDYYNDSANTDDGVLLVETIPAGLEPVEVRHTWNAAYGGSAEPTITIEGNEVTVEIPTLEPLEGGRLEFAVVVAAGLTSGTPLVPETLGTAYGANDETRSGYAACTVFVENADPYLIKLADNPAPRAGEAFNYTLVVSNQGKHPAADFEIIEELPSTLELVPGSVVVTPGPWSVGPPRDPALEGGKLVWARRFGNALGRNGDRSGILTGSSGNVSIIFSARVKQGVLPGTPILNCAEAKTITGQDHNYDNRGCVTVTTPLPDPMVTKTAPPLKKPGEKVTWTITYSNEANEVASGVVVIDKLPDNPLDDGDGKVDVTFAGALAPSGVQIWYYACSIATGCSGTPTFSLTNTTGWSQSPTPPAGQAISYVAFWIGDMAPLA